MTGKQGVIVGVALFAVLGLGVLVYQQMSTVSRSPSTTTVKNTLPLPVAENKSTAQSVYGRKEVVPETPDAIVDEIVKEVSIDNSALNDEELGEIAGIESEGGSVSDFGTVYEEASY